MIQETETETNRQEERETKRQREPKMEIPIFKKSNLRSEIPYHFGCIPVIKSSPHSRGRDFTRRGMVFRDCPPQPPLPAIYILKIS